MKRRSLQTPLVEELNKVGMIVMSIKNGDIISIIVLMKGAWNEIAKRM